MTVVGYPDHTAVTSAQSVPELAGVKMAITSLRALAVVTLLLVAILTAGLTAGTVMIRGQVSTRRRYRGGIPGVAAESGDATRLDQE